LRIAKVATLAVTSIVFFYTGNFWLCWLIHGVLWLLLAPAPARDEAPVSPLTALK
jgi:hypothetical protein